jgi:hypothetical protein
MCSQARDNQRHILRDRRPCTSACPGYTESETVCVEEKNIFYWDEQSRQGRLQIYCAGTTSPTNQPWKD